jgi:hypothetical protein
MKFSLREQLLVTVTAALAIGWFLDHRAQVAIQGNHRLSYRQAVRQMEMYESVLRETGFGIARGSGGEATAVTIPPYFTGYSAPASPWYNPANYSPEP